MRVLALMMMAVMAVALPSLESRQTPAEFCASEGLSTYAELLECEGCLEFGHGSWVSATTLSTVFDGRLLTV
jgi:hypothetical protein